MNFNELINLVSSNNTPTICIDSRVVKKGDVFVAVKGTVYDGHDFIEQALANGAKYIVCEQNPRVTSQRVEGVSPSIRGQACPERSRRDARDTTNHEPRAMTVIVDDSSKAAAILAQAAKGNPASQLTNLAVTGTNGKTTVTYLVRSCIQYAGQKCGLIGTVIYDDCSGQGDEAALTTPDCLTIAAKQAEMIRNGAEFMVIEASSHALSQNRLACIDFKAAAFTNLTGDHLDYHKTKEDYLAAKTRLFTSLSSDAVAVLNKESPEADFIAEKTNAKVLWYGITSFKPVKPPPGWQRYQPDLVADIESMDVNGTIFSLNYAGQSTIVKTPLIGRYNISNHLAAAGLCLSAGFDLQTIAAGLSALQAIPGRLEKIDTRVTSDERRATIIIDYAHTDDALQNVLSVLKPLCKGKLRVVFGCGGDRDKTKRPRMARVAEQFADFVIVTSDNPRTEDPQKIINDIVAGFTKERRTQNTEHRTQKPNISVIPDRKKAIETAIAAAGKDDIVLIAGKGHEDYQIIGKTKIHFSDKEIAQEFLEKIHLKSV